MHREKDDLRVGVTLADLSSGINAIEQRHRNVSNDEVGLDLLGCTKQGTPIIHNTHDLEVWAIQNAAEPFDNNVVVVS
jgi:hypothetical protein